MRSVALAIMSMFIVLPSAWAAEPDVYTPKERGLIKVEIEGELIKDCFNSMSCVRAKTHPGFDDTYLIPLLRSEDKNRALDEHLAHLAGKVVVVRGYLRYLPRSADGKDMAIHIQDASQVQQNRSSSSRP